MNMVASQQPGLALVLVIQSGPDKGSKFKLLGSQVTIGRSRTCDIQLKDQKVSRVHAVIEFTPEGLYITEQSKSNRMIVNGVATKRGLIRPGSKIKIANNTMTLEVDGAQKGLAPTAGPQMPSPHIPNQYVAGSSSPQPAAKSGGIGLPKILIALVALFFMFLLTSEDGPKEKEKVELLTQAKVEAERKKNEEAREAFEDKVKTLRSRSYREAQAAFKQGFRDYKNALYSRARDSFQACLSLDPSHKLCERYRVLANRKFDELVQYKMVLGRRYKEKNLWPQCVKEFENILYMIQDENNLTYKEADSNKRTCQAFMGGGL